MTPRDREKMDRLVVAAGPMKGTPLSQLNPRRLSEMLDRGDFDGYPESERLISEFLAEQGEVRRAAVAQQQLVDAREARIRELEGLLADRDQALEASRSTNEVLTKQNEALKNDRRSSDAKIKQLEAEIKRMKAGSS